MVPSYMLCSQAEVSSAFSSAQKGLIDEEKRKLTPMEASNIVSEMITDEVIEEARNKLVGYRTNTDQINSLKDALKVFEGTHPFHNYTRRISGNDDSAKRYIISFVPLDPVVVEDTEWIPVQVTGQSFLLNQIRKMISAAVDLARGAVTREEIEKSLTKKCRMKVNVAPAQGLFLDRSFFDIYNRQKAQNTDHRPLKWVEGEEIPPAGECSRYYFTWHWSYSCLWQLISLWHFALAVKRIEEFKNDKIIPHIVEEEAKEGNFLKYLYCQDVLHAHDIYSILDSSASGKAQSDGDDDANDTEGA